MYHFCFGKFCNLHGTLKIYLLTICVILNPSRVLSRKNQIYPFGWEKDELRWPTFCQLTLRYWIILIVLGNNHGICWWSAFAARQLLGHALVQPEVLRTLTALTILKVSCVLYFRFTRNLSVTRCVMSLNWLLIFLYMFGNCAIIMHFIRSIQQTSEGLEQQWGWFSTPDNFLLQFFYPCEVCECYPSRCDRS